MKVEFQEWTLQFFRHEHLPEPGKSVAEKCEELAHYFMTLPCNPERSSALRDLLKAKDAAVRASLSEDLMKSRSQNNALGKLLDEITKACEEAAADDSPTKPASEAS